LHGAAAQLVVQFIHPLPQTHLSLSIIIHQKGRLNLILADQLVQQNASFRKFETIAPDPLS
jgi:hypothetical protein